MLIIGDDRMSRIMSAVDAAAQFQLSREQALEIARQQIEVIKTRYGDVCDEAGLSEVDRALLWRRQILNPFAFEDAPADGADARQLAKSGDVPRGRHEQVIDWREQSPLSRSSATRPHSGRSGRPMYRPKAAIR